eukprot:COSAG01_NODE_11809_length_1854_cov_3.866667_1_plen_76_part_10
MAAEGALGDWAEESDGLLAGCLLLLLLLLSRAGQPSLLLPLPRPRRSLNDPDAEVVVDRSTVIRAPIVCVSIEMGG